MTTGQEDQVSWHEGTLGWSCCGRESKAAMKKRRTKKMKALAGSLRAKPPIMKLALFAWCPLCNKKGKRRPDGRTHWVFIEFLE